MESRVAALEDAVRELRADVALLKTQGKAKSLNLHSAEGLHALRKEVEAVRSALLPGLPVKPDIQ